MDYKLFKELREVLELAGSHLEYCNYGDKWERECAFEDKLPQRIAEILEKTKNL